MNALQDIQLRDYEDIDSDLKTRYLYENLRLFHSPKLIANIPTILIRIFGRNQPFQFYLNQAKELAYLFGAIVDFSDPSEFFSIDDLTDFQIEEPVIKETEVIPDFRSQLLALNWNYVGITEIILKISQLDPRESIVVAYCFGLLPETINITQFLYTYEISNQSFHTCASSGFKQLTTLVCIPTKKRIFETIKEVRDFLEKISQVGANDLLRFSDGKLVSFQSKTYELALLISQGCDVNLDHLSKSQILILKFIIKYWKRYRCFPTYQEIEDETGLNSVTIYKHIQRILVVANNQDGTYLKTQNGKFQEAPNSTLVVRIINAYEEDPTIIDHINLSELQKQCLMQLIALREESGIAYPTLRLVAKTMGLGNQKVSDILDSVLRNLTSEYVFFNNKHERLGDNDIRIQILKRGGLEFIDGLNLRSINKKMITLLLELVEGTHTFRYNVEEVVNLIGARTRNPSISIYHVVSAILKGENDGDIRLADENGVALTRNHLRVVELLKEFGVEALESIQPAWNYDLVLALASTNEGGLYLSYESIGRQLNIQTGKVSKLVKKFIRILENLEG